MAKDIWMLRYYIPNIYIHVQEAIFTVPNIEALARMDERDAIPAVAGKASVPLVGLWLEAPADALATQIGARRGNASDATAAMLQRQLADDLGRVDSHRIDAGGLVDAAIDMA